VSVMGLTRCYKTTVFFKFIKVNGRIICGRKTDP